MSLVSRLVDVDDRAVTGRHTAPFAPGRFLGTAMEHVSLRVPRTARTARAGDVRRGLERQRFDTVEEIAVCEGERLVGLLDIEDLMAAADDTPVGAIMDSDPPVVAPGTDQEIAAWRAVGRSESSLAVVDAAGRLLGLIPAHRVIGVLLDEHEEDIARLAGYARGAEPARTASEEPLLQRLRHRLPWLLVGLAGALLAADIVAAFEGRLRDRVVLAFFIPGVVYLADAIGTQTEALVIRGLSVGVPIRHVFRRELLTGAIVGAVLAALSYPLILLRWGESDVALSVALALFAAASVATLVAMILPWVLHRAGMDPAFGSGPLATVIQDLLSIVLYFAIAGAVVAAVPLR